MWDLSIFHEPEPHGCRLYKNSERRRCRLPVIYPLADQTQVASLEGFIVGERRGKGFLLTRRCRPPIDWPGCRGSFLLCLSSGNSFTSTLLRNKRLQSSFTGSLWNFVYEWWRTRSARGCILRRQGQRSRSPGPNTLNNKSNEPVVQSSWDQWLSGSSLKGLSERSHPNLTCHIIFFSYRKMLSRIN